MTQSIDTSPKNWSKLSEKIGLPEVSPKTGAT
jgi:hypothetical protein